MQPSWIPDWNKGVIRRSGAGQPAGVTQSTGRNPGTPTTPTSSTQQQSTTTRAQPSTSGVAPLTNRHLGDITLWMDKMDATDAGVRASINSPVPQGNTFAKFGVYFNGLVTTRAEDNAPGIGDVYTKTNYFNPNSPLLTPVTSPGIPFPAGKLQQCTERLLQRDEDNGLVLVGGMDRLGEAAERLSTLGVGLYDHYNLPGKAAPRNVYGVDPTRAPVTTVAEVVGTFSDKLVNGVGGAAAKLTEALHDVISRFGDHVEGGVEAFRAKPTAFLGWFVDYQQTMKCYYACLAYALECLEKLNHGPDCHGECSSPQGIEALAGTRIAQIARFSQGC